MYLQEIKNECLTCNQQGGADSLRVLSEVNSTMPHVLMKHFWFTAVDFAEAIICQNCWDQVNLFHKFYVSVEDLYSNRLASQIIKSEPALYEDETMLEIPTCKLEVISETQVSLIKEEPNEDNDGVKKSDNADCTKEDYDRGEDNLEETQNIPENGKKHHRFVNTKSNPEAQLQEDYMREHVKYACEKCGEECKTFILLRHHTTREHGIKRPFVLCCGKKFDCRGRLYDHVRLSNNPDLFRCELCQTNFTTKVGLGQHKQEYHTSEEKRFKCNRCAMTFTVRAKFSSHVAKHEFQDRQPKKHPCSECPVKFNKARDLRQHVRDVHKEALGHKCRFCERIFDKGYLLNMHVKSIHPHEWQELQNSKEDCEVSPAYNKMGAVGGTFLGVSRPGARKICE